MWMTRNSLIQFGHGRYQQRIQATVTVRTSPIALELASDKEETNRILGNLGLPVPRQRLVQGVEDSVEAAESIGYPVVAKPFNAILVRGSPSTSARRTRCGPPSRWPGSTAAASSWRASSA